MKSDKLDMPQIFQLPLYCKNPKQCCILMHALSVLFLRLSQGISRGQYFRQKVQFLPLLMLWYRSLCLQMRIAKLKEAKAVKRSHPAHHGKSPQTKAKRASAAWMRTSAQIQICTLFRIGRQQQQDLRLQSHISRFQSPTFLITLQLQLIWKEIEIQLLLFQMKTEVQHLLNEEAPSVS